MLVTVYRTTSQKTAVLVLIVVRVSKISEL